MLSSDDQVLHHDDAGVVSLLWPCEREAFRIPDRVPVSEWCNQHIVLRPEYSVNYSGPYRWQMMPFQRDILDIVSRPELRHLVLKFSTQIGKTTLTYNLIAYAIDQDPASAMLMYPSDDECKVVSRTRLQPHFAACEPVKRRIPNDRSLYQLQEMHFPGMVLYLVSGSSVTGMSQRPIRRLYRDEINKYPRNIGEYGNPMALSEERIKATLATAQIIDVSSPTTEDGNITMEESKCQVILKYYVPCPHCGHLQTLEWSNPEALATGEKYGMIVFEDDKELPRQERVEHARATAHYVCRYCRQSIEDENKVAMLSREAGAGWYDIAADEPVPCADPIGDLFSSWRERGRKLEAVAFRLSSIYSPWISYGDVVKKFLEAHLAEIRRRDELMSFYNDWLGTEWKQTVTETTEDEILSMRCELAPRVVPRDAVALVAGIDMQKKGFYFCVWAFAKDATAWLIHYGYLLTWDQVTQLIYKTTYPIEGSDGEFMKIWRAGIDTGGGKGEEGSSTMTRQAYQWIATHGGRTVFGTKGSSRELAGKMKFSVIGTYPGSREPIPGAGVMLWHLDTDYFKDLFFDATAIRDGDPGCVYLHAETESDFAAQLTSEEKRVDRKSGRLAWVHVRGENHYLDATVGAWAMADPICLGGLTVLEGKQLLTKERSARSGESDEPAAESRQRKTGNARGARW